MLGDHFCNASVNAPESGIGLNADLGNTTGSSWTALGRSAGHDNITGSMGVGGTCGVHEAHHSFFASARHFFSGIDLPKGLLYSILILFVALSLAALMALVDYARNSPDAIPEDMLLYGGLIAIIVMGCILAGVLTA